MIDATATAICSMGLPSAAAREVVSTYSYGSLASRKYAGTSHFISRQDIDAGTGLPSKTYDIAGLDRSLIYDTSGRIVWVKPNAAHDGWRQYIYSPPVTTPTIAKAKVQVLRYANGGSTTLLAEEEFQYDGLGRLCLEFRKAGGATVWSARERAYTPQGWLSEQTTWTANPATAGRAKFLNFDPYGRPKYVDPPEGAHHRIEFFYSGERRIARQYKVGYGRNTNGTIAEHKAGISESFDLMGRLRVVEEGSINNNSTDLIAEYSYNVDGRLSQARLRPRNNSSSQIRTFDWDRRGFLLSEEEPESGKWYYANYSPTGNYGRKYHSVGGRDLAYEYDAADRLIRVADRLNGNRTLQEWTFATTNSSSNWKLGRIESARRYNYPRIPFNPTATATVEVKETYTYGGRGGRPSARRTEVPAFGRHFDQTWTYDPLGNVATLTYPRCGFAACTVTAAPARTIAHQYEQDVLVGVANWASVSYHDNGMVKEVRHQNGMIDTYDRDPLGLARVYNVRVQHPGRPPAQLGWHEYDGMGNLVRRRIDASVAAIDGLFADTEPTEGEAPAEPEEEGVAAPPPVGENFYLYDDFGRLTHFSDGSSRFQSYSYDSYSNLVAISDWNGSTLLTRNVPVSVATNRLAGYSYDAAGNMTSRPLGSSSEVFEYGALGDVVSRNFPAETHLYTVDGERLFTLFYQAGLPIREEYTVRDLDNKPLTIYERTDASSGELWAWKKDYIYRDGLLLGMTSPETRSSRSEQHFSLDHLGTPRVTTDKFGTYPAIAIHHYWGFGEEYWSGLPDPEKLRFAGQERAFGASGVADDLDYLHARYYSSFLGRFQSPDPRSVAGLQAAGSGRGSEFFKILGRPHALNRYAYGNGNPLLNVDPNGEAAETLAMTPLLFSGAEAGGAAVGAGASTVALPVTAALAGGALVGTAVNQIPGISDAVSGAIYNVFFATKANDARDFIGAKVATIYEHITKYGAPDPDDPDDKSRKKNIGDRMLKHLEQAKHEAKHLKGKSKEAAEHSIRLAEEALRKWISGKNVPK